MEFARVFGDASCEVVGIEGCGDCDASAGTVCCTFHFDRTTKTTQDPGNHAHAEPEAIGHRVLLCKVLKEVLSLELS